MTEQPETVATCGYVAFYKGKRIEVRAATAYKAQVAAAELLGARKSHDVAIVLAETACGKPVVHRGDE